MLDPVEEEKVRIWAKAQISIFFSFFTALIMYTFVLFVITKDRTPEESRAAESLRNVFIAASILVAAIKLWVQTRFASEEKSYVTCRSVDEVIQKFTRYHFILLALSEIPALLGLIIVFLTMRMEEWWIFFGISAFLFATSFPSRSKLQRIAEAYAARHQG
jgi:cytochrome bd-type quinol oxidase subunit 2